ncbi:MAG: archaellin/type IV pilin N-terminal domain-containing protein [Nitrososphaerales archaeon]
MTNGMTKDRSQTKDLNRSKKGISPVVATVILVAVAVVIAAALAGFSSSLFGTYSATGSIELRDVVVYEDGSGSMIIKNVGSKSDSVVSAQIPPFDAATADPITGTIFLIDPNTGACTNEDPVIQANAEAAICLPIAALTTTADPDLVPPVIGQQITMTIKMKSGVDLTRSVTVSPGTLP